MFYFTVNDNIEASMTSLWALTATILVIIGVVVIRQIFTKGLYFNTMKDRSCNGIPYAPFTFWETLRGATGLRLHKILLESSRKVGLVFQMRGPNGVVIVGDIDIARDVLNDRRAIKPNNKYKRFRFIHGQDKDLLTSEGLFWVHSRKGIAPAFSSNHIKRMTDVSLHHVELLSTVRLEHLATKHTSMDVAQEMISLTFDIICEAAFQYQMPEKEKESFLMEMEITLKECYAADVPFRHRLGRWIPGVQRAVLAQQRTTAIAQKIIENYRELQNPIKGTVIDCIMQNKKAYESDTDRIVDVLILILAGHETTAFTLAWTLIELAKHPSVQIELRQAINSLSSPLEGYRKCEILRHIIQEAMRLHPVASTGSVRTSQKEYTHQMEGSNDVIVIPKGTKLAFSPIVYFLSDIYFDRPSEFCTSRWKDPSQKAQEVYIPFALGRRSCIGKPLATAELYTIIPYLISKYEFSVEEEGTEEFFFTLKPKGARLILKKIEQKL